MERSQPPCSAGIRVVISAQMSAGMISRREPARQESRARAGRVACDRGGQPVIRTRGSHVPIVAARNLKTEEGDLLLLWVRFPDDSIEVGIDYVDDDDLLGDEDDWDLDDF